MSKTIKILESEEIRVALKSNFPKVLKAMEKSLGSVPEEYRTDRESDPLGSMTDEFHSDMGLPYVMGPSHMFFLVDDDQVREFQFGQSDNEVVLKIAGGKNIAVVAT